MTVVTEYLKYSTEGNAQVINITEDVSRLVGRSGVKEGLMTVSVIGSTGAVTTCEYEPGLVEDIGELMQKLVPPGSYQHDKAWGDGNGHSHLRSSLIGPSLSIPFSKGSLLLGTWQQVIFIDFDNRARRRQLVVQCMGES
ncbi:MAG TPA: secondary thiamine-phosphate synthase enzyme YjbQ [Candidatus Omnitrophota bacterium]|jgi:secondary thiamine-phosphate synthase enzyme|nr:secondary thiamine-phosphate synthase enzyme YjbQ [Candidatus Omnitrophota bacterium]HSA31064.1 secondary thiamine-phosphate synthase enzyme YjbQ [Candidatus Omnitrophota bacterium]